MSVKIIKYKWSKMEPFFCFSGNRSMKILGSEISMDFNEKKCIGYFSKGRHHDCDAHAGGERQCTDCQQKDDFFMCVKCTGDECMNKKARSSCERNMYSIYLAAFGPMIKVGISHEFRLMERLVEQGADFGMKIASVRDGKDVRMIESMIRDAGINDRLTGKEKSSMLLSDPNSSIKCLLSGLERIRSSAASKYLSPPEIYDMREHYMLHNITSNPSFLEPSESGSIKGRIIAAKGNLLVIDAGHGMYSLNAHSILGYKLRAAFATPNH